MKIWYKKKLAEKNWLLSTLARPQLKTYIADALHDLTDKASKYSMPPDFTSISFQWHFLRLHFNSNITEEQ